MAMTSISVIMTVFVLNLHYRGPNLKPVPQWIRKCFIRGTRSKEKKGLCFNKRSPHEGTRVLCIDILCLMKQDMKDVLLLD